MHTDRGELRAPLIVDALGWRRTLSRATPIQPPRARLSRGLEVHPHGSGEEMELWIDPRYIRSGYGWSFPARDEVRVGVGSFWPSHHVKEPTVRLAHDLDLPPDGYQGNWIPHQLRPAVEDGVFFVGDSAGHCLPLTAEGIRTAFYFGIACGRELRTVLERPQHPRAGAEPLQRLLRRAQMEVQLAALHPARGRAPHPHPRRHRAGARPRTPARVRVGLRALHADRAGVVRGAELAAAGSEQAGSAPQPLERAPRAEKGIVMGTPTRGVGGGVGLAIAKPG